MRKVIVTCGPRGIGKTAVSQAIAAKNPEVSIVDRDEILIKMFGTAWLSPYTDQHEHGEDVMFEEVTEKLGSYPVVILNCWNGDPVSRNHIVKTLRKQVKASEVIAWHFISSPEVCQEQFFAWQSQSQIKAWKLTPEQYCHDYALWVKTSKDLDRQRLNPYGDRDYDGTMHFGEDYRFSSVVRIYPIAGQPGEFHSPDIP